MKQNHLIFLVLIFLLSACNNRIKTDVPTVVEIIDTTHTFQTKQLNPFFTQNGVDSQYVYQWENHWVIFDKNIDTKLFTAKLTQTFPQLKTKIYEKPFYNFNRQLMTKEKPADEWDNIILTANLVADTTLQNEYLNYHRTQFEKWPEVSKGFCNADFQQLLVYKSGRQLMLVISIPKGKTLDELNPKTTENNPRVNEWNKIMGKYQERIAGAPENVVWVFFHPISNPKSL